MPKANVLVIVSDEETQHSVSQALMRRGYESFVVGTEEAGLSAARRSPYDAVILDADIPGLGGIHTCSQLRSTLTTPIIVITADYSESDVVLALGAGADACIAKPVSIPLLIASVDAAIRREAVYRRRETMGQPIRVRDLVVDLSGCELRRNGDVIPLSPTEFRLIRTFAEHAGHVLTRDQLLDCVWETQADDVFSRTVDVHIGRLRRKIEPDPSRPDYIVTVTGVGYKLREL